MASLTNKIMSAALAAVGVSALSFASTMPASAQQAAAPAAAPGGGWAKYCNKEEDVDICNVQVEMRAATGQPLLMVQLIEMKGKINRAALRVSTPVARLLPAGIQLQVDNNKPTKIEFATCFQEVCVADAPLTDAIIASFKKGTELTLTTHNYQNQPNPMKISLAGFTGVYDGPPLEQPDIASQKKATEDYIRKNQQQLADQLKEAQAKAKAGN